MVGRGIKKKEKQKVAFFGINYMPGSKRQFCLSCPSGVSLKKHHFIVAEEKAKTLRCLVLHPASYT